MADFEPAIDHVLRLEGGYVNDPADPGGATNYGISLRWLRALGDLDEGDLDQDGDIDQDDIAQMPEAVAASLYYRKFWVPGRYEEIHDQSVANKAFDLAVLMGPTRAHQILQRAYNEIQFPRAVPHLRVDGKIGPITINAINSIAGGILLYWIHQHAKDYFERIIDRNKSLERFRRGWYARLYA